MNSIIEAVSLSKQFTDSPVIVVTEIGKEYCIVLIHSNYITPLPEEKIAQDINLIRLGEVNVMKNILEDDGRAITHLFSHPIVIKDELHIVPLIMEHTNRINDTSSHSYGNLSVCFKRVNDIDSFLKISLAPFLNITKKFLEKSDSFCLFHTLDNGDSSVYACWEVDEHYEHIDLMRHLVHTIPESNLHSMAIEYFPVSPHPITQLQKWSTSLFLPLIGKLSENDDAIREIFSQYLSVARVLYKHPEDFIHENLHIINRLIPYCISPITKVTITNSDEGDILAKVLNEYRMMLRKNMGALYSILEEICPAWKDIRLDKIPNEVRKEIDNDRGSRNGDQLFNAYRTIITSSLSCPFHSGFFPFCINELLPIILHI